MEKDDGRHVLMCEEHVPIMWEVRIAMIALLCARFLLPKLAWVAMWFEFSQFMIYLIDDCLMA
jgi:hypothetical protein